MSQDKSSRASLTRRTVLTSAAAMGLSTVVRAQQPAEVKVGLIVPLSGIYTRPGQVMRMGAEMGIEHINAQGGIKALGGAKLKLVVIDCGDTTEKAKNAAQRMVAQETDLVAATGAYLSSFTLAVTEVTERAQLPVLTLSYSDLLTERGFKFIFQTAAPASVQSQIGLPELMKLAEAASGKRPKTVAMLMDNTATSVATAKALKEKIFAQLGLELDLTQRPAIEAMMDKLLSRLGTIDIVINNAVVRHFAPVEQFLPDRWEEALAVNLSAPFHLIRLALPAMKQHGWGRIINMGSIYSTRAVGNRIDYVTTKTAILGMTRAVAIETATTGITCNALCPGTLPTPAIVSRLAALAESENLSIDEATRDYLASRQPSRRFVSMQNVGATVVFLCSPAARDITGAAIPIDGGWSAV